MVRKTTTSANKYMRGKELVESLEMSPKRSLAVC